MTLAPYFENKLQGMLDHPLVGDARQCGLLGALELVADKGTKARFDPSLKLRERLSRIDWDTGIVFRAFGDNILGFAPALTFSEQEFDILFERLRLSLDMLLKQPEVAKAVE
ncbi:aminotransferase class III-fold pyridoxal phosphate-dependent enzyme [Parahaliea maris]|uniref:Aminotransferase class III-fold pyridoxal phosphate-dependent enzyme n=1 Tax=Parahaliea maris TaxID=2716870 RepID=A0A5C8ZR95_9GAMM|nr:aminotransferase class III-fold pyridoxal phosphate-dependent enzyme [Parahaliea maris]TXS89861.1 aminotransferase class III-fold pyridoxal phosphate-dependent enzyme [Parahaliea maris]